MVGSPSELKIKEMGSTNNVKCTLLQHKTFLMHISTFVTHLEDIGGETEKNQQ